MPISLSATSIPKRLPLAASLVTLLGLAISTAEAAPMQPLMRRPTQHGVTAAPATLLAKILANGKV